MKVLFQGTHSFRKCSVLTLVTLLFLFGYSMAFGLEIAGQLTSIKRSEDGTVVLELYAGRLYHLKGCVDVIACTPINPELNH